MGIGVGAPGPGLHTKRRLCSSWVADARIHHSGLAGPPVECPASRFHVFCQRVPVRWAGVLPGGSGEGLLRKGNAVGKSLTILVGIGLLAAGECAAQKVTGFWPATLLGNAWGMPQGVFLLFQGMEFEEDSGDFPTTKVQLQFRCGLARRWILSGKAQQVRFHRGEHAAWGGAESSLGLRYQLADGGRAGAALQLRGELSVPSGGMSVSRGAFSGGVNASWRRDRWGFHLGGEYTAGKENDKTLGVSEVDRWRTWAGTSFRSSSGWDWTLAVMGARPLRRQKPAEWSLELGLRLPLSEHWSWSGGAAGGLREKGMDWLLRSGVDYRLR